MKQAASNPHRLIGQQETQARTGLSKSTIWRLSRAGKFPKPISFVDARKSLFVESEIEAWISARIADRDRGAA